MNQNAAREMADVLVRVKEWPSKARLRLARQILEMLEAPEISEPPKTMSLSEVIGVLKTKGAAPSDEECDRILQEERLRKYG